MCQSFTDKRNPLAKVAEGNRWVGVGFGSFYHHMVFRYGAFK